MLETADFDPDVFTNSQQRENDKGLLVRFYTKSVQDQTASNREGRPIFREKEYIEIRIPGNRTDAVARPASASDKSRFPDHYRAFKERTELPDAGTPLKEWPVVSRSQAEELAFYHIKTVEQLASLSDGHANKFMGINTLREKAKHFLEASKDHVEAAQLRDELKQRDEIIAGLQAQMDALMEALPTTGTGVADVAVSPKLSSELDKPAPKRKRSPRRKTPVEGEA